MPHDDVQIDAAQAVAHGLVRHGQDEGTLGSHARRSIGAGLAYLTYHLQGRHLTRIGLHASARDDVADGFSPLRCGYDWIPAAKLVQFLRPANTFSLKKPTNPVQTGLYLRKKCYLCRKLISKHDKELLLSAKNEKSV